MNARHQQLHISEPHDAHAAHVHVYVHDVDATYRRALAAGAAYRDALVSPTATIRRGYLLFTPEDWLARGRGASAASRASQSSGVNSR